MNEFYFAVAADSRGGCGSHVFSDVVVVLL